MTIYSPLALVVVAIQGGFTGADTVATAVAVALAESGGKSDATNINADKWHSIDRGLWQINSHWHPEVSPAQAFDAVSCAKAAATISHGGTNWSAGSSTRNGAAQAQMGRAAKAVADYRSTNPGAFTGNAKILGNLKALGGSTYTAPTSWTDSVVAIGTGFTAAAHWLSDSHNWIRILEVVGGSAALLIGLNMIASSGVGGPVGAVASGTTKVTKAAAKGAAVAAL